MEFKHVPIMLNECLEGLDIKPNGVYVDATLGGAGHSSEIAKRLNKDGVLIGIDRDQDAIAVSTERLKNYDCTVHLVQNNFKNYLQVIQDLGYTQVDGILIDLGVSSYQIDNIDRGFSYKYDAPLDMRMNQQQDLTAYDIVNTYTYEQLIKILFEYGEEDFAKVIARNIIKQREIAPIDSTGKLVKIIEQSYPTKLLHKGGSVAKKTFQALRIEVNGELEGLQEVVEQMLNSLKPNGRMCVLTFHSLEDRIVKNVYKSFSTDCICPKTLPICVCHHKATIKMVNKKPIMASEQEQKTNSRSSSCKLRIAQKI